MEKRQSFQQVVLEQLDIHMQKVSSTDHVPFTKINSKWIIDLNAKCKPIKLSENSIEENLDDILEKAKLQRQLKKKKKPSDSKQLKG